MFLATAWLVAVAAADPITDSSTLLLTYGPLGIFTLLAILAGVTIYRRFNTLWTERETRFRELHAAEKDRADAAEKAIRDIHAKIADLWVPALTRTGDVLAEVTDLLRRERR